MTQFLGGEAKSQTVGASSLNVVTRAHGWTPSSPTGRRGEALTYGRHRGDPRQTPAWNGAQVGDHSGACAPLFVGHSPQVVVACLRGCTAWFGHRSRSWSTSAAPGKAPSTRHKRHRQEITGLIAEDKAPPKGPQWRVDVNRKCFGMSPVALVAGCIFNERSRSHGSATLLTLGDFASATSATALISLE